MVELVQVHGEDGDGEGIWGRTRASQVQALALTLAPPRTFSFLM